MNGDEKGERRKEGRVSGGVGEGGERKRESV